MKFRKLIKQVQDQSGVTDSESLFALTYMVENLAVHLNAGERKDFADELPAELHDRALLPESLNLPADQDLVAQFMQEQGVDQADAERQVLSSWGALKAILSPGEVAHIRAQLPLNSLLLLR